ncbi:hypothetical protein [Chryseobacterium potabilaquae]|uniref:Uncharacterized protein n=1 Tax=Chryseobacterium potabilaquae TaxID=2675057 RepID=A0A6N4X9H6_9FLAO|nr:hypothetical protein [Chryseobacterium potabilaquae]CAA7197642.1 hypothetical protein CHRY9293_03715 [Chryseobacterium potabilaquae]
MNIKKYLGIWTFLIPILAWLSYVGNSVFSSGYYSVILTLFLMGSVLAAVYHS